MSVGKKSDSDIPTPVGGSPDAFLGTGSKVVGTLTFTGPVELGGVVEGEVSAQDKLVVNESAVIKAKINGSEVLIKGSVTGDISASKRLILKKPAKVVGNISTSNLTIEEGVIFEGKCNMGGTVPTQDSVKRNEGAVSSTKGQTSAAPPV